MRKTKESTSANDSVNLSSIKPVFAEQIRAIIKFLPIFENINPEDLARVVKPPALAGESLVVGHLEHHPAVYEFM